MDTTRQPSAADREQDELERSLRAILTVADGRRVLFWILERAGLYRNAFSGEDAATNYTLGRQAVGHELLALMDRIDPRLYPTLLLDVADMKAMAIHAAAQSEDDEDG